MIGRAELMSLAQNLGLQPHVVEKDYVVGWLLAGIHANAELREHWVFKGGTCLEKCHFETYRFSEDLDFTITSDAHLDQAFLLRVLATSRYGYANHSRFSGDDSRGRKRSRDFERTAPLP
jgi:predicted nucleotidyltransferase component of viral defense system